MYRASGKVSVGNLGNIVIPNLLFATAVWATNLWSRLSPWSTTWNIDLRFVHSVCSRSIR